MLIDYKRLNERGRTPRPLVYMCGPYTVPNANHNIKRAIEWAERVEEIGAAAFVPHLNHLWDMIVPHDAEFWLEWDLHMLKRCDAIFRMPGVSPGGDNEIVFGQEYTIPTFYNIGTLLGFIREYRAAYMGGGVLTL